MKLRLSLFLFIFLTSVQVFAHEIKSGYLEITENSVANYSVQWKSPMRAGRPLPVIPSFPETCTSQNASSRVSDSGAFLGAMQLSCKSVLQEKTLLLQGLDATLSDVIIRFNPIDDKSQTLRATPKEPEVFFARSPSRYQVAQTYIVLGVEHILLGIDHLLFVLALLLLITGLKRLVITITAFTIAHSITLIATSLNWISIPITPVEAVIALSIVFLANEIALKKNNQERLSEQQPWTVAFIFGLLHGFGFAGALANIGLPEGEIPTALLSFNIGVEIGQLIFVCSVLLVLKLINVFIERSLLDKLTSYAIGICASFWLFERLL